LGGCMAQHSPSSSVRSSRLQTSRPPSRTAAFSSWSALKMRKSIAQAYCASTLRYIGGEMPRPSPVTDEVRRLLDTDERHAWSIDELFQATRSSLGSADYSSVFRAVSLLERQGVVDKIDLGDGRARFELREGHHEHIRCERCGRVEEVPGCVLDDATAQVHNLTGFKVTSHRVVFGGLCRNCATSPTF